jgi:hypothetical protein
MMRRLFETVGIIDLYSDIYRQHSHTGKAQKLGFFETKMEGEKTSI